MDQNNFVRLLICAICSLAFLVSCHSRQGSFYRIERGDTLWKVAHAHDVDIDEIMRANPQLDTSHLKTGDKVFLPRISEIKTAPKQKLNTDQWIPKKQKPSKEKVVRQKVDDSQIFKFQWPYKGPVISTFGMRNEKMHNGIDIQIPSDQAIRASFDGKVVYAGDQIEGYDRVVILLHDNHFFTIYAYLGEILVRKDQIVKTGTPIGKPRVSSPSYLHFEIRYAKTALDPERYLKK
jgi:murein DD-endopeptidase MepM/ murein hydrolase activator NlpD